MIEIIKGWSFKRDEFQYILVHEYQKERMEFGTKKPTGEFVTKQDEVGYFNSLQGMLRRLAEILAKDKVDLGVITTIREYIDELERLEQELCRICKGY